MKLIYKQVLNTVFYLASSSSRVRWFCASSRNKKMSNNLSNIHFKFSDYDVIGFDLDNTLVRYKVNNLIELEYGIISDYLVEKKGYDGEYLKQKFDPKFIIKGLFIDADHGNILRISDDGSILQAYHGMKKKLSPDEIKQVYTNSHWKYGDIFCKDPLSTWNGENSEKIRGLMDYFDISCSLVFARAVDTIDKREKPEKYTIWKDIFEALGVMFGKEYYETGKFFQEMRNHPEEYYFKCSENLISWLQELRKRNKKLVLLTGSFPQFAENTASFGLGDNWRDLFDMIVCTAKKPGFFSKQNKFLDLDGNEVPFEKLQLKQIYTNGNWTEMLEFLKKHCENPNPSFLYIGDNMLQDVYTPHQICNANTVAICEELEAEGRFDHPKEHLCPEYLLSDIWGSYFEFENRKILWYDMMIKHSKLSVPNLEYVAKHSIDHEYKLLINYE